jgi:hypothetical protein
MLKMRMVQKQQKIAYYSGGERKHGNGYLIATPKLCIYFAGFCTSGPSFNKSGAMQNTL